MSVTEVGALHSRYIRLSDRFKSIWTYHQFASGVYKNLLNEPLPYTVEFQKIYDRIKEISGSLNTAQAPNAITAMSLSELALDRATGTLLGADDVITPSVLRRFFEKLKKQDESIIHHLIKFYLYGDAVEGDRRDKLDFLFTRIGEDFLIDRGEYWSRDSLEFRERVIALVAVLRTAEAPQDEVMRLIRAIRTLREEIQTAETFEELTDRNLLKNARTFKHRVGDLYFHPDILMAIVELNVTTKNRFTRLYQSEEQRLMEDAEKLMEHGTAIERNFGDSNPDLVDEMTRFREFKERFDESRANSNVKHDVISSLKSSMTNILSQLDRGLDHEEETTGDLPAAFFSEAQRIENITDRFGGSDVLLRFLLRMAAVIDSAPAGSSLEELIEDPGVKDLRLESWEINSYQKLFAGSSPDAEEDNEELWVLYMRAAALRIKVDEEATILATSLSAGVGPEAELLTKAKESLDTAKELDELFGDFLHEAVYYSNPRILHQLYRSRFRLLRGFSGLWLIYDRQGT